MALTNKFFYTSLIIFVFAGITLANNFDKKDRTRTVPNDSTETNIYQDLLNDQTDDLMENHPADDIYNNIWTSTRLNPYKIPIDSLPDSVKIDMKGFVFPAPGAITSNFGPRRYRYHYGTDIRIKVGDSIVSAFDGKVRIIDYERRGYGHYVVIRHKNGLETVYAHLSEVLVKLDQDVKAGQLLAWGGNTGRSTGPHLHFETRYLGNAINAALLVDFENHKVFADNYLITKKSSFAYQKAVKQMKAAKYYKVRNGDTLGRIASKNGTSIGKLCKLNGISTRKILRIGQRIRVR